MASFERGYMFYLISSTYFNAPGIDLRIISRVTCIPKHPLTIKLVVTIVLSISIFPIFLQVFRKFNCIFNIFQR